MELGLMIKQARLECGMSQRQLCGARITRNMLSQIEHGTAKPSMETLRYLSERLGKSVSYFLDESVTVSENQGRMESARRLFDAGDYAGALLVLEAYREPDPVYDREKGILQVSALLGRARQALEQGREPFARELLERAAIETAYCHEELERQRLLLLGSIPGETVGKRLPSMDRELLIRAREALEAGDICRGEKLLEAAQDQKEPNWCLLRGELYAQAGQYRQAAACFHEAEDAFPKQAARHLEDCYRELGDYKQAYAYACKNRNG